MRLGAYAHNKEYPDARAMILDALGIDGDMIPRERAVYMGDDGPIIHTRTGGGNRDQYDTVKNLIEGEYGIDHNIAEYKEPAEWLKKTPLAERKKIIRELEKRKQDVLATMSGTNDYLRASEYYLRDEDDDFDYTYADFFYKMPPGLEEKLKEAKFL